MFDKIKEIMDELAVLEKEVGDFTIDTTPESSKSLAALASLRFRADLTIAKLITREVFGEGLRSEDIWKTYDMIARERAIIAFVEVNKHLPEGKRQHAESLVKSFFDPKKGTGFN